MTSLEEILKEMFNLPESGTNYSTNPREQKLLSALQAVLAIPESQHLGADGPRQTIGVNRYNEALADVHATIEERLVT